MRRVRYLWRVVHIVSSFQVHASCSSWCVGSILCGVKHSYIQICTFKSTHPRSHYTQCLIWHRLGRLMTARLVLHHLQVVVQALHRRRFNILNNLPPNVFTLHPYPSPRHPHNYLNDLFCKTLAHRLFVSVIPIWNLIPSSKCYQ